MTDTKNSNQKSAISTVAIVLLLGLSAFLGYNNYQKSQLISNQNMEMTELDKVKIELEGEFEEALTDLEAMKGDNEELNALIETQKEELTAQKNKIAKLIRSKKNLKSVRAELETMKVNYQNAMAQITQLQAEKEVLVSENMQLNQAKGEVEAALNQEVANVSNLTSEKAVLVSQKEDLEKVKADLAAKVTVASVIKVGDVTVTGWKTKKSGKSVKKKYARNIDHLKICFNTTTNNVVEPGHEMFYVRIINPQGETIAIEDMGSGVFKNSATGDEVRYTQVKELDYNRDQAIYCFNWKQSTAFEKGGYKVEVYNKGYLAGNGTFLLK